jgi:uncharacterized protein (TIGR00255 family)
MTVYSMTGFAAVQTQPPLQNNASASASLHMELRSVNSRFLDIGFKLSDDLRALEPVIREQISKRLRRGKVEVRAYLQQTDPTGLAAPSAEQLAQLRSVDEIIRQAMPSARGLSVSDVLRLCDARAVPDDLQAQCTALGIQALDELQQARAREGAKLCDMLRNRVQQLSQLAQQAAPLIPKLVSQQRDKFLQRWAEALQTSAGEVSAQSAQDRALTEATAFALRIDVSEELVRLAAHLEEITRLLDKGGEVGKRLDFLIQELHREANTLGSKSATLELSRISVDMKVLIEQMREQVQNLE